LNFLDRFSKNIEIPHYIKIRPAGGELFRADRQTDWRRNRHDEANGRIPQFCKRN